MPEGGGQDTVGDARMRHELKALLIRLSEVGTITGMITSSVRETSGCPTDYE